MCTASIYTPRLIPLIGTDGRSWDELVADRSSVGQQWPVSSWEHAIPSEALRGNLMPHSTPLRTAAPYPPCNVLRSTALRSRGRTKHRRRVGRCHLSLCPISCAILSSIFELWGAVSQVFSRNRRWNTRISTTSISAAFPRSIFTLNTSI